jgi:Thioredoxin-like
MKIPNLYLAVCLMTTAAAAQELTWPQLVQQPELWPTQCTLKRGVEFPSGAGVPAGQTVEVQALHANLIEVGTLDGKSNFDVKPGDTDALAVAAATYATLTPKQRALTYAVISRQKTLWPYHVTLKGTFDLGGGERVRKGDQVVLENIEGGKLLVGLEKSHTNFHVDPADTDLIEQVRQFVESKDGVPSRVIEQLQPNLIGSTTGQPAPLNTNSLPRYLVFIRAANYCPVTRKFMPSLVKFYDETKPKHPEFEIIYLSCDGGVADMEKFAKAEGFDWPAVTYERSTYLSLVVPYFGTPIPQLTVMDRDGKVLISGVQSTAPTALQQLAALLDKPAEQN